MSRPLDLSVVSVAALLTLAASAQCGGPPPGYSEVQGLMNVSCTLSSCHGSSRQGMLSLTASDSYCALVGNTGGATALTSARGQFPRRVVPGNRAESFLYKKLTLTPAESGPGKPLGDVMPQNQPFVDKTNIELFGKWIDAGARDASDQPAPGACP
jgi:hypothetical protein